MKESLNTEIIAVGTELLLGQISNTNATWISEQLAQNGINTYYHTVVGDNLERVTEVFQQAMHRSDVIIVTGGLGPTEDDLSREAFRALSNIPIVTDNKSMEKIEQFYVKQNRRMTENNRRQARVFKDSQILANKFGMAPGNIVKFSNTYWIFLPGVPREMKQIFTDSVIPYLTARNANTVIQSTVLKFTGIGESALEDRLTNLIQMQQNPTIAPLAQNDGVTIRITAKAANSKMAESLISETKDSILQLVGDYYYGSDDETIEQRAASLLTKKKKTISSAESLTGGLFADKMVAHPGISTVFKGAVVCYSPAIKRHVLHVPWEIIEEHGTVSSACAKHLAENVSKLMHSDIGISFTGVAGPEEIEGKQVGTVFIGIYDVTGYEQVEKFTFSGDRKRIRYHAVLKGYELLINYLKKI